MVLENGLEEASRGPGPILGPIRGPFGAQFVLGPIWACLEPIWAPGYKKSKKYFFAAYPGLAMLRFRVCHLVIAFLGRIRLQNGHGSTGAIYPKILSQALHCRTLPPTWVPGPQNLVWDYGLGAIWAQNGFWGN